jgi:hypothetical protein
MKDTRFETRVSEDAMAVLAHLVAAYDLGEEQPLSIDVLGGALGLSRERVTAAAVDLLHRGKIGVVEDKRSARFYPKRRKGVVN